MEIYMLQVLKMYLPTKVLEVLICCKSEMFFVPPLNCATPNIVNNIPIH